jgi:hypothetical protein
MMSEPRPLDRAAVQQLTRDLLVAVQAHYEGRPIAPASAQEVLGALAAAAAVIIAAARGSRQEAAAREFFDRSLDRLLSNAELRAWARALSDAEERSDA